MGRHASRRGRDRKLEEYHHEERMIGVIVCKLSRPIVYLQNRVAMGLNSDAAQKNVEAIL